MRMEKLFDVTGDVSLVAGASSGLGLAMAEVMADNGARVIMVDTNADRLNTVVARMHAANLAVEAAVADVADFGRLREVIDGTAKKHGRLDSVFANAGISAGPGFAMTPKGQIDAIDMPLWLKVLQVNLTGVLVTMAAAAGQMKRQGNGRIIVTSSSAGADGRAAGRLRLCCGQGRDHQSRTPGGTRTRAVQRDGQRHLPGRLYHQSCRGLMSRDPVARGKMEERVALHRLAKTDEIKGLALLLASPAASFITGAAIPIDGGLTAG